MMGYRWLRKSHSEAKSSPVTQKKAPPKLRGQSFTARRVCSWSNIAHVMVPELF
jgi:hypothetical protein